MSDIRCGGSSMNVHFYPSKAEKAARTRKEVAALTVEDNVLVALN